MGEVGTAQNLNGRCLCGGSVFDGGAEARFAIQCYCRDCQHVSGGGSMPQVAIQSAALSRSGPIRTFAATSDAGNALGFSFCADCGSPLFKTTAAAPDLVFLGAGALDEPDLFTFGREVFEVGRRMWDKS